MQTPLKIIFKLKQKYALKEGFADNQNLLRVTYDIVLWFLLLIDKND